MTKKRSDRLISRRESLRIIGAAGATAAVGLASAPVMSLLAGKRISVAQASTAFPLAPQQTCIVRPQLTEGPYFVDEKLNRSDIRTDPATGAVKAGLPLTMIFNVSRITGGSCVPLSGAYVDIWHCDATGSYSDVRDAGFDTRGQKYLRGYQVTDANGVAQFITIFPGWYAGRAVHIHFKIRMFANSQETYEFTSQLFFDDSLIDQIHAQAPYNTKGTRDTRNSRDGIYNGGGSQLIMNLAQDGQGVTGTFNIALEGITVTTPQSDPPAISGASISGKQLIVTGQNFDSGATLFMDGTRQKKTSNDELSPTTVLIARKSGKQVSAGQTVTLQVRNSDNSLSNEYQFTRPA